MLGDFDNDGVGDLFVTESGSDFWIVYLNSNGTVKNESFFQGFGGFGATGALLGDLDNDGVMDIATGAQFDDDGGTNQGAVWILFMNANGTERNRVKISATQGGFTGMLEPGDELGQSVSPIGDVNRDGIPDLLVGAEHADSPDGSIINTGELWILHLNRDGTVKSHQLIKSGDPDFTTLQIHENLGQAVTYLGDLDGDGVGDIAASADGLKVSGGGVRGGVFVMFMEPFNPPGNNPPLITNPGMQSNFVDDFVSLQIQATDPDNDDITYSSSNLPPGLDIDPDSGLITGTANTAGTFISTVIATDDDGGVDNETFTWVVQGTGGGISASLNAISGVIDLTAEGTADWTHWSGGATNLNRKAGVAEQISDYTQIGGQSPTGAGTSATYNWSDGTPNPSNSTKTGIRVFNLGSGFRITAPANTTPSTLKVYLGAKNARGQFTATLSDGSAAPYSVLIDQPSGLGSHVVTLNYQAGAAGQTLTVEYTMETRYRSNLTASQINLESATLVSGGGGNLAPVLANINNQTITEGDTLIFSVTATDPDGPPPLILSASNTPSGSTFTDFGNGMGQFSWTNTTGAASNSPYTVTFSATEDNGNGLSDSQQVTIIVNPVGGGGGNLTGTPSVINGTVDLTLEGITDWAHWSGGVNPLNRKSGVTPMISDYTLIGSETPVGAGTKATYDWTDGAPTASNSTKTGIRLFNLGSGFRITAPADTSSRTLNVYVGAKNARGQFTATLSDGSAVPYSVLLDQPSGLSSRMITLNYRAASAGQTLTIEYVMETRYKSNLTGSQINLESATQP